jgi:REP element-mobilizing transposase RayT
MNSIFKNMLSQYSPTTKDEKDNALFARRAFISIEMLFAIGGMPDHIHALVSMSPKQSPSDFNGRCETQFFAVDKRKWFCFG